VGPREDRAAAALSETSGEFGVAVGVAALGSLGTAVYQSRLPESLPSEAVRESVVAAMNVPEVLAVAREAFAAGFNAVALVGALVFACLAVVTAAVLRRHGDEPEPVVPVQAPVSSG
jgi:DHA2 family multidrug resistance protein-like MFS transporter